MSTKRNFNNKTLGFFHQQKGQALVETAIAFIIFMPFLIGGLFISDCIHLKRISSQAAQEAGRAVITSSNPRGDAVMIAEEILQNQQFFFEVRLNSVILSNISPPSLKWHNKALKIKVIYEIKAPFLGQKHIFSDISNIKISSETIVNKWNNAVILNIE